MNGEAEHKPLKRGWTTGACATAATAAALEGLWAGSIPDVVTITLPKGQEVEFAVTAGKVGQGWAEAGIVKDAGDDPDVTHGVTVMARVESGGAGVTFSAGEGVGTVTMPGLPIAPGEPAINPVPRDMIAKAVDAAASRYGQMANVKVTVSIPGGEEIAKKTWNPRLGIVGGLSILGTTGIVRPFSCSAWIASIHRGIDVARAQGLTHLAGCTGNASEAAVQKRHDLPDQAMIDMGDFAGGMLKYLRRHPVERVTIGGGIGKMTKLAQGAIDLHSARSQVDFSALADLLSDQQVKNMNTALEVYDYKGKELIHKIAPLAKKAVEDLLKNNMKVDVVIVDRSGAIIGRA